MVEINTEDLVIYKDLIEKIRDQFIQVCSTDPNFYDNYNFEISNEQYYVPDEDREPGKIYIVVKFQAASVDYGSFQIPITIQAVSEANGLVAAQRLLLEYAQIFNLTKSKEDGKLTFQYYQAPSVISNFEVVYDGFRSILAMTGTIFTSTKINLVTLVYFKGETGSIVDTLPQEKTTDLVQVDETVYRWVAGSGYQEYTGEEIDILNFNDTYSATPDSQPYFKNKNFSKSEIKYGTDSFNISSFLTDEEFFNRILKIKYKKKGINGNFFFRKIQDNGINSDLTLYKLISAHRSQNKAELPTISMSFTE